jgi:hypothetical protein
MTAHERIGRATGLVVVASLFPWAALAQQPAGPSPAEPPSDEDARTLELAKKTQNPIADLISLPLQNNLSFGRPTAATTPGRCRRAAAAASSGSASCR